MLSWFRPRCPVNICEKVWTERGLNWLAGTLGPARMRQAAIVLPTRQYFPDAYSGTHDEVRGLLDRVCGYMQVDPASLELEFHSPQAHPDAGGLYRRGERSVISVAENQLDDQERLIATLAHEVAHEILLGGELLTGDEPDHEWLTDLTVSFLGMGIFAANTAVQQKNNLHLNWESWTIAKHGYMPARMSGYALALIARARGETKPAWAASLGTDAHVTLRDGLHYVEKTSDTLFDPDQPPPHGESRPLSGIVSDLGSTSASRRLSALWDLRERSEPAVLEGVLKNLRDRDPLIRAEAADTLAVVADPEGRACKELMDALRDEIAQVRARAALALATLKTPLETRGPFESTLREELVLLMSDGNPRAAFAGTQALAAYAERCGEAATPLSQLLKRALSECDYARLEELLPCVITLVPDSERFLREDVARGDEDLWRLIQSGLKRSKRRAVAADARAVAGPWHVSSSHNALG